MKTTIAATLLSIALAGCVSAGTQVKPEQLSGFTKGVTTFDDVVRRLGQPNTTGTKSNGTRTAVYTYVHAHARPESFIPVVGAFVGGSDSTVNTAEFTFDTGGKLLEYSMTESNYGTGTGLAGGTYRPRTPEQPKEAP